MLLGAMLICSDADLFWHLSVWVWFAKLLFVFSSWFYTGLALPEDVSLLVVPPVDGKVHSDALHAITALLRVCNLAAI